MSKTKCSCGCGETVRNRGRFISGHNQSNGGQNREQKPESTRRQQNRMKGGKTIRYGYKDYEGPPSWA